MGDRDRVPLCEEVRGVEKLGVGEADGLGLEVVVKDRERVRVGVCAAVNDPEKLMLKEGVSLVETEGESLAVNVPVAVWATQRTKLQRCQQWR